MSWVDKLRSRFVDDLGKAWKWLSIQFAALAAALTGIEESAKQGWLGLPDDIKASLGTWMPRIIGGVILFSILGRLWKQKPASAGDVG